MTDAQEAAPMQQWSLPKLLTAEGLGAVHRTLAQLLGIHEHFVSCKQHAALASKLHGLPRSKWHASNLNWPRAEMAGGCQVGKLPPARVFLSTLLGRSKHPPRKGFRARSSHPIMQPTQPTAPFAPRPSDGRVLCAGSLSSPSNVNAAMPTTTETTPLRERKHLAQHSRATRRTTKSKA